MSLGKLTGEPDMPASIGTLMQMFDACANGGDFSVEDVCSAAANFLSLSIRTMAYAHGVRDAATLQKFARDACDQVVASVLENHERTPKPSDVVHHRT